MSGAEECQQLTCMRATFEYGKIVSKPCWRPFKVLG